MNPASPVQMPARPQPNTSEAHTSGRNAATVAAHQIVIQLWAFMALVLDAVAIAAQSLVGAALGRADAWRARSLAWQVSGYGLVLGVVFGVVFAALAGVLPEVFTRDAAVLALVPVAWWFFVALLPVAGVVLSLIHI